MKRNTHCHEIATNSSGGNQLQWRKRIIKVTKMNFICFQFEYNLNHSNLKITILFCLQTYFERHRIRIREVPIKKDYFNGATGHKDTEIQLFGTYAK